MKKRDEARDVELIENYLEASDLIIAKNKAMNKAWKDAEYDFYLKTYKRLDKNGLRTLEREMDETKDNLNRLIDDLNLRLDALKTLL